MIAIAILVFMAFVILFAGGILSHRQPAEGTYITISGALKGELGKVMVVMNEKRRDFTGNLHGRLMSRSGCRMDAIK